MRVCIGIREEEILLTLMSDHLCDAKDLKTINDPQLG
jgi:hypothetical protein